MRSQRHLHRKSNARHGNTTMIVLVALPVLLLLLAVVIDLGRMSVARKQLQSFADASALAAAGALQDRSVLFPGQARQRDIDKWVDAPATRAGERGLAFAEEALRQRVLADQTTMPKGHIKTGHVGPDGEFVASDNEFGCNAIEVNLGFTAAKKNSLPLLITRWLGKMADVEVVSVATIDQRLVGFAPQGNRPCPVAPLVLKQDSASQGWYEQAGEPTNGFNDRWTVSDSVQPGEDGIPELVFRIPLQAGDEGGSAWRAQVGATESWPRQMADGLLASDLDGGTLELNDQGSWHARAINESASADDIVNTLRALTGQPRIWPLGNNAHGQVNVTGFAAGQVVECWDEGNGWIAVSIQPCTLTTDTAVVSESAPENPWIGKVALSH